LIAQREREIANFVRTAYYSLFVDYEEGWRSHYYVPDGEEKKEESSRVLSEAEAKRIVAVAKEHSHILQKVTASEVSKAPPAPSTTSTLQQEAGSQLGFDSATTMQIAQKLYEQGYITYLRTDSAILSDDAIAMIRSWLSDRDPQNLPSQPRNHKNSSHSQEGHEAIRPCDLSTDVSQLDSQQKGLYDLIWKRTVASQCCSAKLSKRSLLSQAGDTYWRSQGQTVLFSGYLKYWSNIGKEVSPMKTCK
jgi:DNA topoisomerase-1